MRTEQINYSKKIVEVADFMFENPDKKTTDIISVFSGKFRKTSRTIESYVRQAKEYNKTRIQKQELIRDAVMIAETKESYKAAILNRDACLKILSSIARGEVGKDGIIPSISDTIRAIQQLAKMQGWDEAQKIESTITINNPLEEIRRIYGINSKIDSRDEAN